MRQSNPTQTLTTLGVHFRAGTRAELVSLVRHHYRTTLPATACAIRVATICRRRRERVIGVAVLSWPVPLLAARNRHFGTVGYRNCLRFANRNVRTVSRVIVHPQFRAAGVAGELVRQLVRRCTTRYVESSTRMGAFAGFLIRAGFVELPARPGEPAYFLRDRSIRRPRRGAHRA